MKKAVFGAVAVAVLAGAGWQYASPPARDALMGFIGMAARRDTGEVRRAIGDMALPKDPAEQRTALTAALDRRVRELQRRELAAVRGEDAARAAGFVPDTELADVPAADVLAGAAEIITELKGAPAGVSPGTRVTERILERLLPGPACRTE